MTGGRLTMERSPQHTPGLHSLQQRVLCGIERELHEEQSAKPQLWRCVVGDHERIVTQEGASHPAVISCTWSDQNDGKGT